MKTDRRSNGLFVREDLKQTYRDPRSLISGWGDAFIHLPEKIPFLDAGIVDELCKYLKLDMQTCDVIREVLPVIQNNSSLKALKKTGRVFFS